MSFPVAALALTAAFVAGCSTIDTYMPTLTSFGGFSFCGPNVR
jgi:hypothetical protein